MNTPILNCVNHLVDEYRRFIRSTYRLADSRLREQFERRIEEAGVIVKGPYVTLSGDFETGATLFKLTQDGLTHPALSLLHWPFGDKELFLHQEKAFRVVSGEGNAIVTTGTGSGKTESFLLPIIDGVLKLHEQGIKGTKAIIIYPMNALANDQLLRLRKLFDGSGITLTFALYTGESERVAPTLGAPLEKNELVSRDAIRKNPPDIILTNYKELEFMLIRKTDQALFSPSLRYLVLDEIHSYRGALATEIAFLIRRLKSRAGLREGQLRCLGTSATVAESSGGDNRLLDFVSSLFGESFRENSIIKESRIPRRSPGVPYLPPAVRVEPVELAGLSIEDQEKVLALAQLITGKVPPSAGTVPRKIEAMFSGNVLVDLLVDACSEPHSIDEILNKILAELPDGQGQKLTRTDWTALIEAYLIVGSVGTEDDPPALRPKLHTFFHGVYDVGICMNPACRKLVEDGSTRCPDCHSVVYPAALCRTCGQDFAKVRFSSDPLKPPLGNESFSSDDSTGFITPKIHTHVEDPEPLEVEDGGNSEGPASRVTRKVSATAQRLLDRWVCNHCGMVHDQSVEQCQNNDCRKTTGISLQKVFYGRGSTCPACNGTYTRGGDILSLLRTGVASSTSLLATHHLDRLEGEDRKLLVFADNRQDAAHQAGYMKDRQRLFIVRHIIESLVREAGDGGLSFVELPHKILGRFQQIGIVRKRLTPAEQDLWLATLRFEAAGEFCRNTNRRMSLENLGLVEVRYEFLEELRDSAEFKTTCRQTGIDIEKGLTLVRGILDRIRRSRSVDFPFFQEYIDPSRDRWALLQAEPYSISLPEHERHPVFHMLDRTEEARNGVGGFKFMALHKDSPHGGAAVIPCMLSREEIPPPVQEDWIRAVIRLLCEMEILVSPSHLPPKVRTAIGRGMPLQLASRVIRLVIATEGYRCRKCRVWHPYKSSACYSTKCSGIAADLQPDPVDMDNYYVKLYTSEIPKRIVAEEHTAQIGQDQRAEREKRFKEGQIDALVCSPTLELGVDIGPLLTVLLRNCPPTPANYTQRAGRAGRRLRIGFVSTFCGMGPHDRHCFEDPAWLVRGVFNPPAVRLDNDVVRARHIRSHVLEMAQHNIPDYLQDLLVDVRHPSEIDLSKIEPLFTEIRNNVDELTASALSTFPDVGAGREVMGAVVSSMETEARRIIDIWHARIIRLFEEYEYYRQILGDRKAKQKANARERAYREVTTNPKTAYMLNFFGNEGYLPSYQFPTDTFSLEPGVQDLDTLRRPSWVALFEFAPGNMVYANGHKLKTIRTSFEGRSRCGGGELGAGLEASGRVRSFCFCSKCGFATEETRNSCPACGEPITLSQDVAFVESFEAEQNTQITSAEEARERIYFERDERLILPEDAEVTVYPYPFSQLEFSQNAKVLVTNRGPRPSNGGAGTPFELCQSCGKHRPSSLNAKQRAKWDQDHALRCAGTVQSYVLGYEFRADALILPVPLALIGTADSEKFCRTLGAALVAGAGEILEVESDEIAFFSHRSGSGMEIVFYETAPGGAGYLQELATKLPEWATFSEDRLYKHECATACYRCLKSYRNQPFHQQLDKNIIKDTLFQFAGCDSLGAPFPARRHAGLRLSGEWIHARAKEQKSDTVIERALLEGIRKGGRLPDPIPQKEFVNKDGVLFTIADFAYELEKIAIYCDGFAFHSDKDTLASDSLKRNDLQAMGWTVLTFWGKTILKHPNRCEEQIWRAYSAKFGRAAAP